MTSTIGRLIPAQYALAVAYAVALFVPGLPYATAVRALLLNAVFVLSILLLLARARRHPEDRGWATALASGVALCVAANVVLATLVVEWSRQFIGEALYLVAYAFWGAALVLAARRFGPEIREGMAIEGLLGALAAATLGAVVVPPLLDGPEVQVTRTVIVSLYPVLDVLLLSMIVGAVALSGGFLSRAHVGMSAGLTMFVAADVLYARAALQGDYVVSGLVTAAWALGVAFIAHGAWIPVRHQGRFPRESRGVAPLAVTSVSAAVAVVVLVVGALLHAQWYVIVLAAATLVLGIVRTVQAMWRLRELVELRHEVTTDALTGLLSRRGFYDEIDALLRRRLDGEVVGVGIVDLDRFKEVNDAHGHAVGDRVLATFGEKALIAAAVQPSPVAVARLGGDEFAFVVSGAPDLHDVVAAGHAVAEAARIVCGEGTDAIGVSASVGVSFAPIHGTDRVALLRAADTAMYAAKTAGRDRVVVFDPSLEPDRARGPLVRG